MRKWSTRRTTATGYVTAGAPLVAVGVPALRGDDGVDGTSLRHLLWKNLSRKEEEEALRNFSESHTRWQGGGEGFVEERKKRKEKKLP